MCERSKKGFTLAELLVVVAIIGILVAVSIPIFAGKLEAARKATCDANKRSAKAELVTMALDNSEDTILNASKSAEGVKILESAVCPSDGYIYYSSASNKIRCTYHDDGKTDGSKPTIAVLDSIFSKLTSSPTKKSWKDVINDYKSNGYSNFEAVSNDEINKMWVASGGKIQNGLSENSSLSWKPVATANGGYIMIASDTTGGKRNDETALAGTSAYNASAYVIYDGTDYYIHNNGYGKLDSTYINDSGSFDVTSLENNNQWTKVSQ